MISMETRDKERTIGQNKSGCIIFAPVNIIEKYNRLGYGLDGKYMKSWFDIITYAVDHSERIVWVDRNRMRELGIDIVPLSTASNQLMYFARKLKVYEVLNESGLLYILDINKYFIIRDLDECLSVKDVVYTLNQYYKVKTKNKELLKNPLEILACEPKMKLIYDEEANVTYEDIFFAMILNAESIVVGKGINIDNLCKTGLFEIQLQNKSQAGQVQSLSGQISRKYSVNLPSVKLLGDLFHDLSVNKNLFARKSSNWNKRRRRGHPKELVPVKTNKLED